jgi:hypothetical protein
VIGPASPDSPVDGDSVGVVSWPNALAGHSDAPPAAAGPWSPAGNLDPGSCPSAANFLLDAGLSEDERYDLLLAVCEAASNAIEHARDPTEPFFDVLTEIADARVTVVVRDHGQWSDGPPGADRGRGMAMMWMLADSRVAPSPQGTTVTILSSPRHRRHPAAPTASVKPRAEAPIRPPPRAAHDRLAPATSQGMSTCRPER